DVCCGTGDIALALARGGAEVIGVDFSQPMLAVAERRKAKLTATATKHSMSDTALKIQSRLPRFIRGDAQHLPFSDNSFDIVTIGYGLRNLSEWRRGLREMFRVAKPGGRLVALDFGKPENKLWRGLYFGYLKIFVPFLGRVFAGNASAYGYILESLKSYPAQH